MTTSLVTGGAGFIGSHVADSLLSMGHDVVVLDDLSGGFRENVPAGAEFVEGSVVDAGLVKQLFASHRFDNVFHLAAYAAEGLSHFIKRFNYTNNVLGTVTLINEAVNAGTVQCFVFTSSIAVYGAGQTPMDEGQTPQPEDSYGIAKYAVELELKASFEMFGLPYVIFRPHNVYGERQNVGDPYRNVLGIFLNQLLSGKPMTVFGDGTQTRAFTHVSDVAPIIARSCEVEAARGETFNIGADTPYSVNELAEVVARALGVEPSICRLEARREVVHAFATHDKVRRVFSPPSPMSLAQGVGRMVAWARERGVQASRPFKGIEILKNLPPSWRSLTDSR